MPRETGARAAGRRRTPGKGGIESFVIWGMIGVFCLAVLFVVSGNVGEDNTPNRILAAKMKGLNREGKFEEVIAMASEVDPQDKDYVILVEEQVELAKSSVHGQRMAKLEEESIRYIHWNIQKWHQDNRRNTDGLVARYDEYLRKFPGTANWNDIADKRLKLAGAPSPYSLRGDGAPPEEDAEGGSISASVPRLLKAAGEEADKFVRREPFGEAMMVYERFLENSVSSLSPADQEPFEAEVKKRIARVEKKAFDAFERLEQKAFTLMETGEWDKADRMYKNAAQSYGIDAIVDRCKVEIDRIRKMRR
jgi:hypothetical protein